MEDAGTAAELVTAASPEVAGGSAGVPSVLISFRSRAAGLALVDDEKLLPRPAERHWLIVSLPAINASMQSLSMRKALRMRAVAYDINLV